MDWVAWIPTLITAGLALLIFSAKHKIKSEIEGSVQHKFDGKIETLRADHQKSEEKFKSELRLKETEISALRDGVLGGRVNRQDMLDKRRLEAVERVWAAVTELAPFKVVSASMAVIHFDAASKRAPHEPNLRKVFEIIGKNAPDDFPTALAHNERPFVSPITWALFSAYQTIIGFAYMRAKILELGIEGAGEFLNTEHVKNLLKTTLPDRAKFIDQRDIGAHYYLLGELEERLLAELMNTLEGVEVDEAAIAQSAKIMKAVDEVVADDASQIIKNEEMKLAASSEK